MKQYPADFRDRLLRALDAGLARAEAARTFGVTERTMRRWQQRRRETGTVATTPRPGRQRRIGAEAEAALRAQVRSHPDATLAEHCALWAATHGIDGQHRHHVARLASAGLAAQKKSLIAAERDEAARQQWREDWPPAPRNASSFSMRRPRPPA